MYHQTMDSETYKKRAGTSGIQGQLYETKLISLIYFRMIHDDSVDQFTLATNRDDIGAFDDICFKAKIKGFEKPISVFIQAKHRENDELLTFTSKTDLAKYFHSYLEIRRTNVPSSKDRIFGGKFDETESFFVMYTTAKDDRNNKIYESCFADCLNELIGTGGCCTQPSYTDEGLDFLCKIVMKEQITTLAELLAKLICDESDSVMWMNHDLMLRYHVILAHNVLHVSEIQPEGHRIASFREDFFTTNEEFLVQFKNILCLEVLKKRKPEETDAQSLLLKFLSEPSEVTTISKLIGSVLTYKNKKLEFVNKSMRDDLKRQLDKANVSQSTVYDAAEMAAKEYLLSLKLIVPAFFGNKDLAIRGKPEKAEKRLNYLTSKLMEILKKSNPNNIVAIDESLGDGFLQLNGGIASAVGNLLVFDESSKLLKFTDNCESLPSLARRWYESLKSKIENLHEYKLDVKVKNFPKLSFERGEYDVSLVRDFYDKLLFYTNQADQNGVEEILRGEIEDHPCSDVNNFRVRSDVIFLKYHDEIQKLWMTPKVGSYLTNESKIYENAVSNAMSEPLMSVLNIMHRIKHKDYIFNENVLKPFELHGQIIGTVIVTESCELTVAKVEQYLGNKDRVVLDLESIVKLPLKNHNTLCKELTITTKEKILIIVSHNFENSCKRLENIAKAVDGKQIIIITNKISIDIMTKNFSQASNVLKDERTVFTDLSVESQKKFLATSSIKLQGKDVSLDVIGDDESVQLIDEDVFSKLINNETIQIGNKGIYNNNDMYYIDRRVCRTKIQEHDKFVDVKDKVLETLYDLEDDVVLIKGEAGIGKSALLKHLSLKTKEIDPNVWIVRILPGDVTAYKTYINWQDENTAINTLESLKFLSEVALEQDYEGGIFYKIWRASVNYYTRGKNKELIDLEESPNGTVSLKKCSGLCSPVFHLKMFLNFYNRGKLIFLFDDCDEFFWRKETAFMSLLKTVRSYPRKHKIWITGRSLNIIEQEFGPSYKLDNFSLFEQDLYINTLLKLNIQIKNLCSEGRLDIDSYINVVRRNLEYHNRRDNCFRAYVLLLDFLKMQSEAAGLDFTYEKYYNILMKTFSCLDGTISRFPEDITPRHLRKFLEVCKEDLLYYRNRNCFKSITL